MSYNNSGYQVKKNLNKRFFNDFFLSFIKTCRIYAPTYFQNRKKYGGWSCSSLSKNLILLRKKDPKKFSQIYDSLQKSVAIKKILSKNNFTSMASMFLNLPTKKLKRVNYYLRIDLPNDVKNSLDWHQDYADRVLCTIWCPLVNVNKKNGTLKILLKSHKDKLQSNVNDLKGKYPKIFSRREINKYKEKNVKLKAFDALMINSMLIHKSGYNRSNKVRFTLISTYTSTPLPKKSY